ncbi:MAG: hypothetical protein PVH40_06570 [Gemmatimonadales bacterium]
MIRHRMIPVALGCFLVAWACGQADDEAARDLSLPPAESLATLDDSPQEQPAPEKAVPDQPVRRPAPPPPQMLSEGTVIELVSVDTISNATHVAGDTVWATANTEVLDAEGDVAIPAGARFEGVIEEIEEAESIGGAGKLSVAFTRVLFGGNEYTLDGVSDSVATETRGRNVTAGDAAKVGAGAAAGAVLGGLISKDSKGAIVGGIVGAAAGVGVAAATKDRDVVLPAGGLVRLVLASPLVIERK